MTAPRSPLDTWGLARPPFENTADPAFYFPSAGHAEALARFEYLARERGAQLGVLTGEIGCGKSLVRALFAAQSRSARLTAQLTSSHYPWQDLLREALTQLGEDVPSGASERTLIARLERLTEVRRLPIVLLFDEAQELEREALVGLRALANLDDGAVDLTMILVGQPELRKLLLELPQLDQRTGLRYHLCPLDPAQTEAYLEFRLRAAGHANGRLFTPEAVSALAAGTLGVPREINRVARLALAVSAARGSRVVDLSAVQTVLVDLDRQRGKAAS